MKNTRGIKLIFRNIVLYAADHFGIIIIPIGLLLRLLLKCSYETIFWIVLAWGLITSGSSYLVCSDRNKDYWVPAVSVVMVFVPMLTIHANMLLFAKIILFTIPIALNVYLLYTFSRKNSRNRMILFWIILVVNITLMLFGLQLSV